MKEKQKNELYDNYSKLAKDVIEFIENKGYEVLTPQGLAIRIIQENESCTMVLNITQ